MFLIFFLPSTYSNAAEKWLFWTRRVIIRRCAVSFAFIVFAFRSDSFGFLLCFFCVFLSGPCCNAVVFVKNTGTPINLDRMSPSLEADLAFYSAAKMAQLRRMGRELIL